MSKTVLLVVDKDWSVVRWAVEDEELWTRNNEHDYEVYAEHTTCPVRQGNGRNPDTATWCWEYMDGVWNDGWEVCWQCEARVSEGAVALVIMMNMDEQQR